VGSKQARALAGDAPRRLFGFCALARPESFRSTLQTLGVELAGWRSFRDHHAYSEADLQAMQRAAAQCGAEGLITTEKDAVKLPATLPGLQVVPIDLQIGRMPELVEQIVQQCGL
jgi:tetraacyldisaccharide 4'-kinase